MANADSFTHGARHLGLTQPTVHHAVTQLEHLAARPLFDRTVNGTIATRTGRALARAARLAFYELAQAEADLAEDAGREGGRIVIGAMPLSRSALLPQALARFRELRPTLPVLVLDGTYDDLLAGLIGGEIDLLIGALRDPVPTPEIVQQPLFDDRLALIAGLHHPLAGQSVTLVDLCAYPWIVPRAGTPTREQFDQMFADANHAPPASIIESGSILLMRELLAVSQHLACISQHQANAEIARGLVASLRPPVASPTRPIGMTLRRHWHPTKAQTQLLSALRAAIPQGIPAP